MSSDGWTTVKLGDVFEVSSKRLGEYVEEPPVFSISKYDGVVLASEYHDRRVASAKLDTYKLLGPKDWAYSTIHIEEGSIARNNYDYLGVVSPMYTILKWQPGEHDPRFFEYLLRSPDMLTIYGDMAQGSIDRRRSLPWKTFSSISVTVPHITEQERIVDLLAAIDDVIQAVEASRQSAAESLVQIRRHVFSPKVASFSSTIGNHLAKRQSNVIVDPGAEYVEIGVRSHGRGVFIKDPVNGEVLGKKRVFHLQPGRLVFNVVFAWEGAVSILGPEVSGMIASHRFPTYESDDPNGVELFDQFFRTEQGRTLLRLCSPGGAGRNKTLNQTALLASTVALPEKSSWPNVVSLLDSLESRVIAITEKLESLQALRRDVMAALLSGAHRIPETYEELMGA